MVGISWCVILSHLNSSLPPKIKVSKISFLGSKLIFLFANFFQIFSQKSFFWSQNVGDSWCVLCTLKFFYPLQKCVQKS